MRVNGAGWLAALMSCTSAQGMAATAVSPQATYDEAQAAFDRGNWAGAAKGFSSLIPTNPGPTFNRSHAVIASRLASALMHLGRYDEARVMGERAIQSLPSEDLERPDALLNTAAAAAAGYDYSAAAKLYQQAIEGGDRNGNVQVALGARIGFGASQTTIDPLAAAKILDAAFADKALMSRLDKANLAYVEDLRARAALNAVDLSSAVIWINRAIEHSGGLSTRVSLSQISMRNDAAIISSLRKNDEETRKYLAYTGAGHLKNMSWIRQYDGDLPVCGLGRDVRPDDNVVIQFSIADDGHVTEATPIYASRSGLVGTIFAQSVSEWQWDPASLKTVDNFWRNSLVLQLRCQSRPSPDSLAKSARTELSDWLASRGVDTTDHPDSYVSPDDPRLASDGPEAIPALLGRLRSRQSDHVRLAARLHTLLDTNKAPAVGYALAIVAQAENSAYKGESVTAQERSRAAFYAQTVPDFQSRYPSGVATGLLVLNWALALEGSGDFRKAYPLLQSVPAMPPSALADDAPIRKVALLHMALAGQRLGISNAKEVLAASGISADQCALFDTHPIATSMSISSSQFPRDALRWHFEGYVKESYDIADDGRVANIRTVVAYPPFIFSSSTEDAFRHFRYVPPKIGNQAVGCTGETQTVNYQIPG